MMVSKNTRRILTGFFCTLAVFAGSAHADAMKLRDQCEKPSVMGVGKAYCGAYLEGLEQGLYISGRWKDCLMQNTSPEQLRLVVTRYMDTHPEELNGNGPNVAARAILRSFRCEP